MKTRQAWALLTTLCVTIAAPTAASATVVLELSRDQLVERADLIVRAKVLSQSYRWSEDHKQILTLSELAVSSYLKGAGPSSLTLRQLGGVMGELRSKIAGDAHLEVGQELVLFLKAGEGVVYLSALSQSAFVITKNRAGALIVTRPDLGELSFWSPEDKAVVQLAPPPEERLEHLLSDLRARAGARR